MARQVREFSAFDPCAAADLRQPDAVGHDQRADELPSVTNHESSCYERTRRELFLDGDGCHVLAPRGHDEFLLAARDDEIPVLVQASDIARTEPYLFERQGRALR